MAYPKTPGLSELASQLALFGQLQHEYGAKNISPILKRAERDMQSALAELKRLPIDKGMADREPNDLGLRANTRRNDYGLSAAVGAADHRLVNK